MKQYILAITLLVLSLIACYKKGDGLPPCDAAPTACGGYPADSVVVTESHRDGGR